MRRAAPGSLRRAVERTCAVILVALFVLVVVATLSGCVPDEPVILPSLGEPT